MMRVRSSLLPALIVLAVASTAARCGDEPAAEIALPGLAGPVDVVVDRFGSPHVFADTDADMARVQGWVHARDRMWQMDLTRREVSGDRAELLGPSALGGDIQNRTIGLRRAAERSLATLAPEEVAVLQAYADGVNAWLDHAEAQGLLPPEYAAVEITRVRRWDPVDTLAIGKGIAASLSLDIDAGLMEEFAAYVAAGDAASPPFDGATLFTQDVRRSAPMDPASTVPDATGEVPFLEAAAREVAPVELAARAEAAARVRRRAERSEMLRAAMERPERTIGSNHWGVAAERSEDGFPIIANDPHLGLGMPSTFYENHLVVREDPLEGPMNVHGVTFPGVPFVILGQNEAITWGATTNPMDVTDLFQDTLVRDPACPAFVCIRSEGALHPVDIDFATYRVNDPSDGVLDDVTQASLPLEQTLVITVPFRSFGPVVDVTDPSILTGGATQTTALVLQFTGFHATGEVQTFRIWNRARDLEAFRAGLRSFDFGSQNWAYADRDGNLAVFTSAEMPLRRDLEDGAVVGMPPFFVRDGSGPNNWVPDPARSQGQAIPFAVLPEAEMPKAINPANGFFANANNDPAGTTLDNDPLNQRRPGNPDAIYYLNPGYDEGLRAGRITRLIRGELAQGREISVRDMKRFQTNTQQLDAELMTPFLIVAAERAGRPGAPPELAALAADPEVQEAVQRMRAWDFSTPTGIPEGYDASDVQGERLAEVPEEEVAASVAATLYNVWRAKAIRATIDARLAALGTPGVGSGDALKALHHLLSRIPYTGVGASGVDFIPQPGHLSSEDRRDLALLTAMRDALDALASDAFAPAFGNSTDQDDYRWGKLHRKTFGHPLGGAFDVPPAGGFDDLAPGLPGVARDGGYEVVNASGFSARADGLQSFRFGGGPVRRYVGEAGSGPEGARVVGFNVIPGGSAGDPSDPLATIQLGPWLTGDRHPVEMFRGQARREAIRTERFVPAP